VQLIFEEVGAVRASVAVVDCEVAALGPNWHIFASRRPRHVQDDAHSVFIVIPLDALVRVCCIRSDQAVCFRRKFGRFEVFQRIQNGVGHLIIHIEHLLCGLLFSRLLGALSGALVLGGISLAPFLAI